jgi:hypothetical protein
VEVAVVAEAVVVAAQDPGAAAVAVGFGVVALAVGGSEAAGVGDFLVCELVFCHDLFLSLGVETKSPAGKARLFPFSTLSSEYQVGGVSLPALLGLDGV